jgi:hypothetical protein
MTPVQVVLLESEVRDFEMLRHFRNALATLCRRSATGFV